MNNAADQLQKIDNIFVDTASDLLSGIFLFLLGIFALFCVKGYFQYLLAKKDKYKNPWYSFVLCFSLAQWWQMGGVSLRWGLLLFIPSLVDLILPNIFTFVSLVLVLLLFLWFTIKATLHIAKKHKLSPQYTYLLFLPFIRLWVLFKMVQKKKIPKKLETGRVIGLTLASLLFTVLLWVLLLYISFGESMVLVYEHVSDPNVTPVSIFNDFLNAEINK